jgi:hypothetical protein
MHGLFCAILCKIIFSFRYLNRPFVKSRSSHEKHLKIFLQAFLGCPVRIYYILSKYTIQYTNLSLTFYSWIEAFWSFNDEIFGAVAFDSFAVCALPKVVGFLYFFIEMVVFYLALRRRERMFSWPGKCLVKAVAIYSFPRYFEW